ncbi:hypothetical protein F511_37966 [Dorcoceras hygrometricum]|uniref:Uncharacterized protein n=1 Tax=Dorcoceras hygrometricum TaxID=472368 RepID=A0A2Z7DCJ6_9LAMI|nr:hypothetical protein F511_37966 [Dorcoceras hygrometricum]
MVEDSDWSKSGSVGLLLPRSFFLYLFRRLELRWKKIAEGASLCSLLAFRRTVQFGSNSPTSPLLRNGKDPLEDFDYNDPRRNPLPRPAVARTPSNTTAHQPANCVTDSPSFTPQ